MSRVGVFGEEGKWIVEVFDEDAEMGVVLNKGLGYLLESPRIGKNDWDHRGILEFCSNAGYLYGALYARAHYPGYV